MEGYFKLPVSSRLPIKYLSASFNKVTNSYKFYWFLSLLDHIKESQSLIIPINHLLARMIASVWYPVNYFRLSFGKQDRLGQIAFAIRTKTDLPIDARGQEVIDVVLAHTTSHSSKDPSLIQMISSLSQYVPYRFLRPFFSTQLRGQVDSKINKLIRQFANQSFTHSEEPSLYRFSHDQQSIEIHPLWFEYLQTHLTIMTGFCLWHLLNYLQKNNPNVPNIATKLFEPQQRSLRKGQNFWRIVFNKLDTISCIYSGRIMRIDDFSLDHFLPWSFVTHDLLWNIVPVPRNINSAKGDRLPDFDLYFEPFAQLQSKAFQAVAASQKGDLLEDYVLLFKRQSAAEIQALSFNAFKATLHDTIAPQIQIAQNMGFEANWRYVQK